VTALRRRGLELACLALGAAILAGTLWAIGIENLIRDLRLIGWGLGVILLVESLSVVLNTGGWALAFPRGERTVSARHLLAARLAGDGVNYLTPSATVGGELLRVRLLGRQVPASLRWASVSAAKIGQSVAQAVFIFLGIALVVPRLAGVSPWIGRQAGAAAVLGLAAAVLAGAAFVWAVGRGFWATMRGALGRVRLAGLLPASWAGPGRDLDLALGRLGPWRAAASLGCFVAGWAVGAAEIYLILHWVGSPVDWPTALALETGSVLLDGMLFFVPAKVGTQEGGKVVLFAALGLNPARGLTVGVVRRIRELTYAAVGLIALAWLSTRSGRGDARAPVAGLVGDRSPRHA
jgi:Lysylphosphatidylglycerol synthase TM region